MIHLVFVFLGTCMGGSSIVGVGRKLLEVSVRCMNPVSDEELDQLSPADRRFLSSLLDDVEIALRSVKRLPPGPARTAAMMQLHTQFDPLQQPHGQRTDQIFQHAYRYVLQRTQPYLCEDLQRSCSEGVQAVAPTSVLLAA